MMAQLIRSNLTDEKRSVRALRQPGRGGAGDRNAANRLRVQLLNYAGAERKVNGLRVRVLGKYCERPTARRRQSRRTTARLHRRARRDRVHVARIEKLRSNRSVRDRGAHETCTYLLFASWFACCVFAQPKYDLLLQGGHVIDAKNGISARAGRRASRTARSRPSRRSSIRKDALKTVNVGGLYVTPGLIDIHVHVYAGTGERELIRRRQQRSARRLHVPCRRDDGGRCRLRRLAQLRGLQGQNHRSLEDARAAPS